MTRLFSALIGAALVVCLVAPPSSARAPSFTHRLRAKLNLKFTTKKPSFYSQRYGELMDRGRLFYLGRGVWFQSSWFYFLRLKDMKRIVARAPVQRFLLNNRHLFPRAGTGRRLPAYSVERLLFYDRKHRAAGLLLDDRKYRKGGRVIYLHWDLRKGRITRAVVLARKAAWTRWTEVKPIGYDPAKKTLYLQLQTKHRTGFQPFEVQVMSLTASGSQTLTTFRTRYHVSRGPFYDRARRRAFVVEYAEGRSRPHGHLVDLRTGKRKRIRIPVVTYGVAFSKDGKRIFAYGAQKGVLWSIDARTGRRLRTKRLGALGHAAGLLFGDTLCVARNKGLHLIDAKTLKQWKFLPTRTWHRGFQHVQGTLVAPGRVFLRTSDLLRVIELKKR